mgnify:FL=1
MAELTHIDEKGNAHMVDVSEKRSTVRTAIATGSITMNRQCYNAVKNGGIPKGDVLAAARIAGIMAAKRTNELIPLCHLLQLTQCSIEFIFHEKECRIDTICLVKCRGRTGVEMEALTGVSVSLLTMYDMCKAVDKGMEITDIKLMRKLGGKSGTWER